MNYVNPYHFVTNCISGKWKMTILHHIHHYGKIRFNETKKTLGVSEKVLSQQLKELTADGLVERIQYNTIPLKVEMCIRDSRNTYIRIAVHSFLQKIRISFQIHNRIHQSADIVCKFIKWIHCYKIIPDRITAVSYTHLGRTDSYTCTTMGTSDTYLFLKLFLCIPDRFHGAVSDHRIRIGLVSFCLLYTSRCV